MSNAEERPTGFVLGGNALQRLERAVEEATDYDNIALLVDEIRKGNPYITREPFRNFIADRLAGKPLRRPGEKPKKKDKEQRDLGILIEVARLVADGYTPYSNSREARKLPLQPEAQTEKKTACEVVAEKFNVSESSVQKIWKARKNKKAALRLHTLDTMAIRLRCEIHTLTGRPAKSHPRDIGGLAFEASMARHLSIPISAAKAYFFPGEIEKQLKSAKRKIFPDDFWG